LAAHFNVCFGVHTLSFALAVMKPLHISVELMMVRIGIVTGAASFSISRGIALHLAEGGLDVGINDLP